MMSTRERALSEMRPGDTRQELRWLVSRPTERLDESLVSAARDRVGCGEFRRLVGRAAACMRYLRPVGCLRRTAPQIRPMRCGVYHSPAYEWLGKGSARLDDVMNVRQRGSVRPFSSWLARTAGRTYRCGARP